MSARTSSCVLTAPLLLDLTGQVDIHDHTETNLVNLRRRIYLTIMSALDFEEAVHKLLQVQLMPGQEVSQFLFAMGQY